MLPDIDINGPLIFLVLELSFYSCHYPTFCGIRKGCSSVHITSASSALEAQQLQEECYSDVPDALLRIVRTVYHRFVQIDSLDKNILLVVCLCVVVICYLPGHIARVIYPFNFFAFCFCL